MPRSSEARSDDMVRSREKLRVFRASFSGWASCPSSASASSFCCRGAPGPAAAAAAFSFSCAHACRAQPSPEPCRGEELVRRSGVQVAWGRGCCTWVYQMMPNMATLMPASFFRGMSSPKNRQPPARIMTVFT